MARKQGVTALDLGPRAALDPQMRAYFARCVEKLGFVPNVLEAYAFDNAKLQAFVTMADELMLGDSGLSKLEREMIAVTVSAINHCHYCLTAHGAAVRQRAGDPVLGELVAQNYRAADLPVREKAMLDFAAKLTEAPDKVEEVDRQALREAGFSDRDIWDIAAVAAFYNMSNRLATATGMQPNRQYHYLMRADDAARRPDVARDNVARDSVARDSAARDSAARDSGTRPASRIGRQRRS
jgi:uncharacterized peroxidase-related enzyme